jgi:mono/diheme cytochrome c family protein
MKGKYLIACLLVCSLLVLTGCGSARRGEPFTAPLEIASADIAEGQQVFMRYCHQCHPGGEGGIGPSLNEKPLPGFLMKFQTRKGLGAMPGFSEEQISSTELDNLITYLKTLRRHR